MDYSILVEVYEKLLSTTKRLEKTYYLSELLKKTSKDDIDELILLLQGRVYPRYDERKIGVAARLVIKAIKRATGRSEERIEKEWKNTGDLGITVFNLIKKKKSTTLASWGASPSEKLTVKKVFNNIRKLAETEGKGSVEQKLGLLVDILKDAEDLEAKYIVRTVLEDLRVGLGEGTLRDAITWASIPPIYGIFYRCESCNRWMPATSKCIECKKELKTKYDKEKKKNVL